LSRGGWGGRRGPGNWCGPGDEPTEYARGADGTIRQSKPRAEIAPFSGQPWMAGLIEDRHVGRVGEPFRRGSWRTKWQTFPPFSDRDCTKPPPWTSTKRGTYEGKHWAGCGRPTKLLGIHSTATKRLPKRSGRRVEYEQLHALLHRVDGGLRVSPANTFDKTHGTVEGPTRRMGQWPSRSIGAMGKRPPRAYGGKPKHFSGTGRREPFGRTRSVARPQRVIEILRDLKHCNVLGGPPPRQVEGEHFGGSSPKRCSRDRKDGPRRPPVLLSLGLTAA